MAAVRQIIGVQRTQQGRFAAAGVTVEHHALPGVNGQRGLGQHRQTHAVLLVQNKGFMDVFNADHVSSHEVELPGGASLTRPTNNAPVGRVRRSATRQNSINSATPTTPAAGCKDGADRRAPGRLSHSPPPGPASSPADGSPAGERRRDRG